MEKEKSVAATDSFGHFAIVLCLGFIWGVVLGVCVQWNKHDDYLPGYDSTSQPYDPAGEMR